MGVGDDFDLFPREILQTIGISTIGRIPILGKIPVGSGLHAGGRREGQELTPGFDEGFLGGPASGCKAKESFFVAALCWAWRIS